MEQRENHEGHGEAGDRVCIELGFVWEGQVRAVAAHFGRAGGRYCAARLMGSHIALEGREIEWVVEGGDAYASVRSEGVVLGSTDPGVYSCRFVHFLVPGRGWILAFENLRLGIRAVDGPPVHREREGARLYGVRFLG